VPKCYRLTVVVPREAVALFERAFDTLGGALAMGGPDDGALVTLDLFVDALPNKSGVAALLSTAALAAGIETPAYTLEALADTDWVAESQKGLPALRAGRFFLYGSHVREVPPAGSIPLLVEAGAAFGTGHHESTFGCLVALSRLAKKRRFTCVLDMGAGSGVLSMAAAKLWRAPVLAVEMDGPSLRVAKANARLNGVRAGIAFLEAAGYGRALVARCGPYDLVLANILAGPLIAMAGDLARHLADGGYAVLGGLMTAQKKAVVARHRAAGLYLVESLELGDWSTLVLRRGGPKAAAAPQEARSRR